ncbi:MAG: pitrilysin family protein [Planctomycetota bacterium]|nr:pitrilysin family protein [Planctomycetota bacterium]
MKSAIRLLIPACVLLAFVAAGAEPAGERAAIPPLKLWKDVQGSELKAFKPPVAERFELPNGMVVFLLEDHELPLIDLSMTLRAGEIHEPPECVGLADATATVMRTGGSTKYPGDKLDEILDNMAAHLGIGMGLDSGSASLSTLKEDFDKGLEILVDVLRNPAFPDDKLDLYLSQVRTGISKRNDNPNAISDREFGKALYGEKSPYAKVIEYAHVNKITRQALRDFHSAYFHPNLFIVGAVGDFKKDEMLAKLQAAFGNWPRKKVSLPEVPSISTSKKRKALFVDRPKLNQTAIRLGHIVDMRRNHKDYPAMRVLNKIMSGGMGARMFTEIRTKKGLAYDVWGYAYIPFDRPGVFTCGALTRNEQALDTVDALREEIVRLKEQGVTAADVAEAREKILNSSLFEFDTPAKIIGRQITYEFYNYPMDFAERQLEAVKAVGVEEVNKAARKYLDPGKVVLLGVGNAAVDSAGRPLDQSKSFLSLKDVQVLDVAIPQPHAEPMTIDPRRTEEGRNILAVCLEAAGGVGAFKGIKTIRADVMLTVRGMRLNACMRGQLPDLVRVDVSGPLGPISQIMAKDAAWKASGGSVEEMSPQDARKNLRTLLQSDLGIMRELGVAEEGYNVQSLDPTRDGDRELIGVEIESRPLGRIKIWFDAQTRLIAKIRYVAEGAQKEYDKLFSDHTRRGSLMLARNIVDKDPAGPQLIEMESLQLNPQLDPALFSKPDKATPPPKDKN